MRPDPGPAGDRPTRADRSGRCRRRRPAEDPARRCPPTSGRCSTRSTAWRPQGTLRWGFDDAMRRLSTAGRAGHLGRAVGRAPRRPVGPGARGQGRRAGARRRHHARGPGPDRVHRSGPSTTSRRGRCPANSGARFDAAPVPGRPGRPPRGRRRPARAPAGRARPARARRRRSGRTRCPAGCGARGGLPVVVGELGAGGLIAPWRAAGADVDAVDPGGRWRGRPATAPPGRPGPGAGSPSWPRSSTTCGRLPAGSRSARGPVGLCRPGVAWPARSSWWTTAVRALAPGGALVVLVDRPGGVGRRPGPRRPRPAARPAVPPRHLGAGPGRLGLRRRPRCTGCRLARCTPSWRRWPR